MKDSVSVDFSKVGVFKYFLFLDSLNRCWASFVQNGIFMNKYNIIYIELDEGNAVLGNVQVGKHLYSLLDRYLNYVLRVCVCLNPENHCISFFNIGEYDIPPLFAEYMPKDRIECKINFYDWNKEFHIKLMHFCTAFASMPFLPSYVLLEIFDWLPFMSDLPLKPKINLITNVLRTVEKTVGKRE